MSLLDRKINLICKKFLKEFSGNYSVSEDEMMKRLNKMNLNMQVKKAHGNIKGYKRKTIVYITNIPTSDDMIKEIPNIYKVIDDAGYFVAGTIYGSFNGIQDPKKLMERMEKLPPGHEMGLILEKYYTTNYSTKVPLLWHVTRTDDLSEIEKEGLKPSYRFKMSYHPDRIYFAISKPAAIKIYRMFKAKLGIEDYSLLKVDINGLDIKLYKDPNYSKGVYTTTPIPPEKIAIDEKRISNK